MRPPGHDCADVVLDAPLGLGIRESRQEAGDPSPMRGLKAISPRAQKELGEIDEFLYDSSVSKVGTVFDSIIAQVQHLRIAHNSKAKAMFDTGRSMIFTDPGKCRAWIEETGAENAAGHR